MDEASEYQQCDGMTVRLIEHDCFDSLRTVKIFDEDIKDMFTFAQQETVSFDELEKRYPSIAYIDYYDHTVADGLSYVQLMKRDLPNLLSAAEQSGNHNVARQIKKLHKFIEDNINNHMIVVFDGM